MAIYLDTLTDSTAVEECGFLKSATRTAIVKLTKESSIGDQFSAAMAAVQILPGDPISEVFPDVRCVRRLAKLIGVSGGEAIVKISYEFERQCPSDAAKFLPVRGGASVTQIVTSKTRDGTPLTIDPPPSAAGAQAVTVKVTTYEIQGEITRQRTLPTNDPDAEVAAWVNMINNDPWHGGGPKEWLCTNVQYEAVNQATSAEMHSYTFTYQFQRNPNKWQYQYVWENQDGTIPTDAVIHVLDWHEERAFGTDFA